MNHKDQAEELRKKMEQENLFGLEETKQEPDYDLFPAGNLPPRSEVHGRKRKKKKKKKPTIQYPLIRLLVVFFILLPLIIISIYAYSKMSPQPAGNTENFEELKLEENTE